MLNVGLFSDKNKKSINPNLAIGFDSSKCNQNYELMRPALMSQTKCWFKIPAGYLYLHFSILTFKNLDLGFFVEEFNVLKIKFKCSPPFECLVCLLF